MIVFIIMVLGIALLLYILLGGADFGAGIVETFSGKKGINTVSSAIAPVWEANHIWLILAVVILFNGFPKAYSMISIYLHIPLLIVLTGIILRGTAFTFRYYDVIKDNTGNIYTALFRVSSFLTPFFLGICLGALTAGHFPSGNEGISFYEGYIHPWVNIYSLSMGLFTTLIFGTLAGVYLIGEAKDNEEKRIFMNISKWLFILLIISGGLVFITSELGGIHLVSNYTSNIFSMISVILATVSIPVAFRAISKGRIVQSRIMVGFQVSLIFIGYVASSFPNIVMLKGSASLTFFNTVAPDSTLRQLTYALIAGVLIIIPAIIYLFRVFKLKS